MNRVILEIGTEEIPALYVENILNDLKKLIKNSLEELKIPFEEIKVYGTPRRLVAYIIGIAQMQESTTQKIKGPTYQISYDNNSKPLIPAIKFAQSQKVKVEELITEDTEKGKYVFALKIIKGKSSQELLAEIFPKVIRNLNFPKSMRWENKKIRFIRPIRWLLALYNQEVIKFNLEGIVSSNQTYGHRLLSPKKIEILNPEDYFLKLKKNYVIVDPIEREKIIRKQIKKIFKEKQCQEILNEDQLKETVFLVEYPNIILGKFNRDYLELPQDVLTTVMEKHQKYFPLYKRNTSLLPFFIIISNGAKRYASLIKKGNENVLKARLEDARFFFETDLKLPLQERVSKLKNVVFKENLGTLWNKTNRLKFLAEYLVKYLNLEKEIKDIVFRAAYLCKADLVTEMVKEFPELQGVIGKEYAILSKEKKEVAETIFEHYLPRYSNDLLPKTKSGIILAIADKVDNITGCFILNLIPTGSQDPYGVRRQLRGVISIILENNLPIPMKDIFEESIDLYQKDLNLKEIIDKPNLILQILNFLQQRIKNIFLEEGFRYDIIEAVLAKDIRGDILEIKKRIEALEFIYNKPMFSKIIQSSNRVANLSKNCQEDSINVSLLKERAELNLFHLYKLLQPQIEEVITSQKYSEYFELIEDLCSPIDEFFDSVLVMDKNLAIRKNRLALIKRVGLIFNQIADLSMIILGRR